MNRTLNRTVAIFGILLILVLGVAAQAEISTLPARLCLSAKTPQ